MDILIQRMTTTRIMAVILLSAGAAHDAIGDGQGVLVQKIGPRLVTGSGDNTPGNQLVGTRVFGSRLGGDGLSQDPSFFSLAAAPTGTEALPSGVDVYWDFLPMTIDGEVSNLFFWDATGQVEFTPSTASTLSLHDPNFLPATVNGAVDPVSGLRLGTTTGSGTNLHAHRWWWLQGDGGSPTDGVYLAALRVRAQDYAPTDPIYVALSTSSIPMSVLSDEAMPWIETQVDRLVLHGDFNFDGQVNDSDHTLWASHYGSGGPFLLSEGYPDGNHDGVVDAADYTVWRDHYGAQGAVSGSSLGAVATPEPTSLVLSALSLLLAGATPRRRV